jgi:hypothetical protein
MKLKLEEAKAKKTELKFQYTSQVFLYERLKIGTNDNTFFNKEVRHKIRYLTQREATTLQDMFVDVGQRELAMVKREVSAKIASIYKLRL